MASFLNTYYLYNLMGNCVPLNRVDATHWEGCGESKLPQKFLPDPPIQVTVPFRVYLRYESPRWKLKVGWPIDHNAPIHTYADYGIPRAGLTCADPIPGLNAADNNLYGIYNWPTGRPPQTQSPGVFDPGFEPNFNIESTNIDRFVDYASGNMGQYSTYAYYEAYMVRTWNESRLGHRNLAVGWNGIVFPLGLYREYGIGAWSTQIHTVPPYLSTDIPRIMYLFEQQGDDNHRSYTTTTLTQATSNTWLGSKPGMVIKPDPWNTRVPTIVYYTLSFDNNPLTWHKVYLKIAYEHPTYGPVSDTALGNMEVNGARTTLTFDPTFYTTPYNPGDPYGGSYSTKLGIRIASTLTAAPNAEVGGRAITVYQLKFASNGLGVIGPNFTALRMGGTAFYGRTYRITMLGGPHLASLTKYGGSKYIYLTTGRADVGLGVTLAGESRIEVAHWSYTTSQHDVTPAPTDVPIGGAAAVSRSFAYDVDPIPLTTTATIMIDGEAGNRLQSNYPTDGGVVMSGMAYTLGAVYHYQGSGGAVMRGAAAVYNSNLGMLETFAGGDAMLVTLSSGGSFVRIGYDEADAPVTLFPDDGDVITACDCSTMPGVLQLSHAVGSGGPLYEFLYRNYLELDLGLPLLYDHNTGTWRNSRHFTGAGQEGRETWHVHFDWGCVSTVGAYDLGSPVWQFGMAVRREQPARATDTRMVVTIPSGSPCLGGPFSYRFTVDLAGKAIVPVPKEVSPDLVFHDGIGMFNKPYYQVTPLLPFQVALRQISTTVTRLDSGVVYPPAQVFPEK